MRFVSEIILPQPSLDYRDKSIVCAVKPVRRNTEHSLGDQITYPSRRFLNGLPDPLGPISPTIEPCSTFKEIFSLALTPPKYL